MSPESRGQEAHKRQCVVYAEPSFTLAADKCTPSYTPTASSPVDKPTKSYASSASSDTPIMSIPEDTMSKPSPPPYTTRFHHHSSNMTQPIHTKTKSKSESESEPGSCTTPTGHSSVPPCGAGSSTVGGGTGAPHTPTAPYATGSQTTVPTAAAANHGAGLLAAAGVVAAYPLQTC